MDSDSDDSFYSSYSSDLESNSSHEGKEEPMDTLPKTEEEIEWENNIQKTPEFKDLRESIEADVIYEIFKLIERDVIKFEDIDETVRKSISQFSKNEGILFFKVLASKDMTHIAEKAPYINAQTKVYSYHVKNKLSLQIGPDETQIERLKRQTGYPITLTEGQRCYGPPPDWEGPEPMHREINISKVPEEWYENRLVPAFSKFGKIYTLRVMVDGVSGLTRHFCFLKYCDDEENDAAVRKLDGFEITPGKKIKASFSAGNRRIFVGNIPKTECQESLKLLFLPHVHGLQNVTVFVSEEMKEKGLKNRGFCLIDFHSHSYASEGKKIISGLGKELFDRENLRVEWCDPQHEPTPSERSKIKCVHVGNISSTVTEEMLRQKFDEYGKLKQVDKVRDYAFIHYEKREGCANAIEMADGIEFGGLKIVCSLSTSGPLLRKIRRQNEKAIARGDYDYEQKNSHQSSSRSRYNSSGSSRDFQSRNRSGWNDRSRDRSYGRRDGSRSNFGKQGGDRHRKRRRFGNGGGGSASKKSRRY
ncbi:putative RNA-binding protein 46 [Mactra antiquata]